MEVEGARGFIVEMEVKIRERGRRDGMLYGNFDAFQKRKHCCM